MTENVTLTGTTMLTMAGDWFPLTRWTLVLAAGAEYQTDRGESLSSLYFVRAIGIRFTAICDAATTKPPKNMGGQVLGLDPSDSLGNWQPHLKVCLAGMRINSVLDLRRNAGAIVDDVDQYKNTVSRGMNGDLTGSIRFP